MSAETAHPKAARPEAAYPKADGPEADSPEGGRVDGAAPGGGRPELAVPVMTLGTAPSVDVGMLIRRPPADVFEALADPAVTTRFWYTTSTGRMADGAELTWAWDMYGVSTTVRVQEAEPGRRIRYSWDGYDPAHPTTVQFEFIPYPGDTTYLRITETGFTGDGDTQVRRALDSTAGFTFLLSSLKAALEHDITLRVVLDAHPPDLPRAGADPAG